MTDTTPRFALPQLLPGQAQKEIWHNEALALIDAALHPVAESRGDNTPPGGPAEGQCWITGSAPVGDWAGEADRLAIWTDGGWRFVEPVAEMCVWLVSEGVFTRRTGGGWVDGVLVAEELKIDGLQVVGEQQPAISNASGGAIVDAEARAAVDAILVALRTHGLIAP